MTVTVGITSAKEVLPTLTVNGIDCGAGIEGAPVTASSDSGKEIALTDTTLRYPVTGLETDGELTLSFTGTGNITYIQIEINGK